MRPQKVDDQQLMAGLMEVIRTKGFEGASMNDLAAASGLKKASLYHRFPGGKQQITEAVLAYTQDWGRVHILELLSNSSIEPTKRLSSVIQNIRTLYKDGEAICILRALTLDPSLPLFRQQIENSFQSWIEGFTKLGLDMGFHEAKAGELAINTVIMVQGSLVLAKGIDQLEVFQKALKDIERNYNT